MEERKVLDEIVTCTVGFDSEKAAAACKKAIEAGIPAYDIVMKGISRALDIVGQKYERGEYFLSELIMAGQVSKAVLNYLQPHLKGESKIAKGTIVIGTVKGDLHDIGKNIVATLMASSGFDVYDIGVDVSAEAFVKKAHEVNADIVGMSALISTTLPYMKVVVDALRNSGVRERMKVIIGGAPTTKAYAEKIGADDCATDAIEGLRTCEKWMGKT